MDDKNFIWFTNPNGVVGIAKVINQYGETNYLIGVATGIDRSIDEQMILDWGNHFPELAGTALFGGKKAVIARTPKKNKSLKEEVIEQKAAELSKFIDEYMRQEIIEQRKRDSQRFEAQFNVYKEPPF